MRDCRGTIGNKDLSLKYIDTIQDPSERAVVELYHKIDTDKYVDNQKKTKNYTNEKLRAKTIREKEYFEDKLVAQKTRDLAYQTAMFYGYINF